MDMIHQPDVAQRFRNLVYWQVLVGIVAFCAAERNPGLILLAGSLAALSRFIVEGPNGRPAPRFVINLATLAAVGWLLWEGGPHLLGFTGHGGPAVWLELVKVIVHFVIWLQVVLLYVEKRNREFGQLMVLSLLTMVGAAAISASLLMGLVLVLYCLLGLGATLMLQLKTASDGVYEAHRRAAPPKVRLPRPKPVVGRGHQGQFQALTTLVATLCLLLTAVVYLFLPRSHQVNQLAELGVARQTTGFSSSVNVNRGAPQQGSGQAVMTVRYTRDGRSIGGPNSPFLLRGIALDRYDAMSHTWERGYQVVDTRLELPESDRLELAELPQGESVYQLDITAKQGAGRSLFSLMPPTAVHSRSLGEFYFSPQDYSLRSAQENPRLLTYSVQTPVVRPEDLLSRYLRRATWLDRGSQPSEGAEIDEAHPQLMALDPWYARGWSVLPAQFARFAQGVLQDRGVEVPANVSGLTLPLESEPEQTRDSGEGTSGSDNRNDQKDEAYCCGQPGSRPSPGDPDQPPPPAPKNALEIAETFKDWLQTNAAYSLEPQPYDSGRDPIWAFLDGHRRGHCEIFAAAHAALCRSMNVPARVITGYRATEYNAWGGYYVIRHLNAHSWTEVYDPQQREWVPFDATPPEAVALEHRPGDGIWRVLRSAWEWAEFLWLSSVVGYNQQARDQTMGDLESSLPATLSDPQHWLKEAYQWVVQQMRVWGINTLTLVLMGLIVAFIILGLVSVVHNETMKHRRLVALQLNRLPGPERRRLGRQLGFYLRMLELLEQHGRVRPTWQSPFGFAKELISENEQRFGPVIALTEHFYEIRFGRRDLDEPRRAVIRAQLDTLEENLMMKA